MRAIHQIILHSSNTDIGTADSISKMHKVRGMKECGYHFIVERDGLVNKGRDVALVGEHTTGHNLDSIGICVVGKEDFTESQLISLGSLMQALLSTYSTVGRVIRHKDLADDACWFVESEMFDKPQSIITE